jgi:hydroxymethylbilane synthase
MSDQKPIRIGTRGSPLALAQAHEVQEKLCATKSLMTMKSIPVIKTIKTTGDIVLDRPLKEIGGKGLFSKEIDEALICNKIDIAVHSMKDLETLIPSGIILAATMEREDPRDVFISQLAASLDDLPPGSTIGTSSLRRQAQILNRRPDIVVKPFRGNVQTRMKKIEDGEVDATLLALAGLKRLKIADMTMEILNPEIILPAVAQGAIGITCRAEDTNTLAMLKALNHTPTWRRITAERAMLAALDGSCRTPIGGLANIGLDGTLSLKGMLANEDGSKIFTALKVGPVEEAEAIGNNVGMELRRLAGTELPI